MAKGIGDTIKGFLARIPLELWVIMGLSAALLFSLNDRRHLRAQLGALTGWQQAVIEATSSAFGTPDAKGRILPFTPEAVIPAIDGAGRSLRDFRTATAAANAGIAATAADGTARRVTAHDAALDYDAAAQAVAAAQAAMRKPTGAPSAAEDAAAAIERGRLAWKDL